MKLTECLEGAPTADSALDAVEDKFKELLEQVREDYA